MAKATPITQALIYAIRASEILGGGCEARWDDACKLLRKNHKSAWKGLATLGFYKGYANKHTLDGICDMSTGYILAVCVGAECRQRNRNNILKMPDNWQELATAVEKEHVGC